MCWDIISLSLSSLNTENVLYRFHKKVINEWYYSYQKSRNHFPYILRIIYDAQNLLYEHFVSLRKWFPPKCIHVRTVMVHINSWTRNSLPTNALASKMKHFETVDSKTFVQNLRYCMLLIQYKYKLIYSWLIHISVTFWRILDNHRMNRTFVMVIIFFELRFGWNS